MWKEKITLTIGCNKNSTSNRYLICLIRLVETTAMWQGICLCLFSVQRSRNGSQKSTCIGTQKKFGPWCCVSTREKALLFRFCEDRLGSKRLHIKSVSGIAIKCARGAIAWRLKHQASVTRSSKESEFEDSVLCVCDLL